MPEKSTSRYNREVLDWALDIYREGMRTFLARELRRLPGEDLVEAIQRSLRGNHRNLFDRRLEEGRKIEECLDIDEFPDLVWNNWNNHFSRYFRGQRSIRRDISDIAAIRDKHSHAEMSDLNIVATKAFLDTIAAVLGSINDVARKKDVEELRDDYLSPAQDEEIHIVEDAEEPTPEAITTESKSAGVDAPTQLPSPGQSGELLPDGIYDCRVTWVTEGVGQGSGQPYFRVTFEELESHRRVLRYYSLQSQAIEHLARMMGDFGMSMDFLFDATESDSARQAVLRHLRENLIGKQVSAEIVIEEWSGGRNNKVDRFFPENDDDDDSTEEVG